MMRRVAAAAFAFAVFLSAAPAHGDVGLADGDFFIHYTDVVSDSALDMRIERAYSSKSHFIGMFGNGWGSLYESRVQVRDDGSIAITEFGDRASNVYRPNKPRPLPEIVDEITAAAEQAGRFGSTAERETYRRQLLTNPDSAQSEWEKLRVLGRVQPQLLAIGASFYSGQAASMLRTAARPTLGVQQYANVGPSFEMSRTDETKKISADTLGTVTRVAEGYQRRGDGGIFEAFGLDGRLVRRWDTNHHFIALHYDGGRLKDVRDDRGNRFAFTMNRQGFVSEIRDSRGHRARYRYGGAGDDDLVESIDMNGDLRRYDYDENHNLTAIHYPEGRALTIAYSSALGNVKRVRTRQGAVTEYRYRKYRDGSDDVQEVVVDTGEKAARSTGHDSYRYYRSAAGVIHRVVQTTESGTLEAEYDEQVGKAKSVTTIRNGVTSRTTYEYDAGGHLWMATNTAGHIATLTYDESGRVATATDEASKQLLFTYDRFSNIVSITLAGVGTVEIQYAANGRVSRFPTGEVWNQVKDILASVRDLIVPAREVRF